MQIEGDDIQAVILRGYPSLSSACFLLLTVEDPDRCCDWLQAHVEKITPFHTAAALSERRENVQGYALNIAFTYSGLEKLGLSKQALGSFSKPFREGMTTEGSRRRLGDHGENSPEHWQWGAAESSGQGSMDILLLCYARDQEQLEQLISSLGLMGSGTENGQKCGFAQQHRLDTQILPECKEHFGFRDGISQPKIVELEQMKAATNQDHTTALRRQVKVGEFVLGYENEYGQTPHTPSIEHSANGVLSQHPEQSNALDFGKNGSYLVFRQMEQRVAQFWKYIQTQAKSIKHPSPNADHLLTSHWLAAKMVGRWMDGTPLTLAPEHPPSDGELSLANHFAYHERDRQGFGCPLGAHIRRTHPRDALEPEPGGDKSWSVNRRHRIMRRGRPYGKPLVDHFSLPELLQAKDDGEERGLHFLCFNSDITRQFEFVQQSWVNNKKFAELYNDADPLIGDHDPREEGVEGQFTLQGEPLRQRVTSLGRSDVSRFTRVVGGGYFFMPGLNALRLIASQENSR